MLKEKKHKTEEEMKKEKYRCENCNNFTLEFTAQVFEANAGTQHQNLWTCKRCRHHEVFATKTGDRIESVVWN